MENSLLPSSAFGAGSPSPAFPRCSNWRRILVLLGCFWLLLPLRGEIADEGREYRVKAGFLFNFAKYVEWPTNALPQTNSEIRIGVLADDPAAPILQEVLAGKVANGRPIKVVLLKSVSALPDCHIFFLSRAERGRVDEVLARARGTTTVTVGEVDQFAHRGGIINFVRQNDAFRFEVNLSGAEQAGLKISAYLAGMATVVKPRP